MVKQNIKIILAIIGALFLFENFLRNAINSVIPSNWQLIIGIILIGYVLFETDGKFQFPKFSK